MRVSKYAQIAQWTTSYFYLNFLGYSPRQHCFSSGIFQRRTGSLIQISNRFTIERNLNKKETLIESNN